MPSRDVNAATRLAEASLRRDNARYDVSISFCLMVEEVWIPPTATVRIGYF